MSIPEETRTALQAAAQATDADVLLAKQLALAALDDGRLLSYTQLFDRLCAEVDVPVHPQRREHLDIDGLRRGLSHAFDASAPQVMRVRMQVAATEALADLAAQGMVVPIQDGDTSGGNITVPVGGIQWSGGARLSIPTPRVDTHYRLVRGLAGRSDFRFFERTQYVSGIEDLVGTRGARCVQEALDSFRRGLYLSSANMLGAASEAAWYTVAEAIPTVSKQLTDALEAESTAKVVRLTAEHLISHGGRVRTVVLALQTHEAYLRTLRNYGLHPRAGVDDDDHEDAFTETGCALLLMQTRSYLVRLREVARTTGVLP
jgi:hypothetical protein